MSKLLETSAILKQLNQIWDEHSTHIARSNTELKSLLSTAATIPSSYISVINNAAKAQDNLVRSSERLNAATIREISEIRNLIAAKKTVLANNKSLATSYDSLKAKLDRAIQSLNKMKASNASTAKSTADLKNKVKSLEAEVTRLSGKVNSANTAVKRLGTTSASSFRTVSSLMGAFGIGTGIYLFAQIVKSIYENTKELQSLDLAMKMVTETEEQFALNQGFVINISKKWGLEIKSLTQQYIQFYTASKGLLSQADIESTFEGIAKAGAVMGLSIEKQSAAFYAIDQMMSKGTVTSEELKKQLGNAMPGAIKAAAMAYMDLHPQITTIQKAEEALYKAMKKGALDSATYVPLIVKNFQKLYGIENLNNIETLISKQNRLENSWTNMVRSMNDSPTGGISKWFGYLITAGTNALNLLTRLNDSWETLNKKSFDKGFEFGGTEFNRYEKTLPEEGKLDRLKKETTEMYRLIGDAQIEVGKLETELAKTNKFALVNPFGESIKDKRLRIEELKNDIGQAKGYLAAYEAFLNPNKPVITESEDDGEAKKRRERVTIIFDSIKAEYELKKAIIERKKVDTSYAMNDERTTLAKRMEARIEFSKQTLALLELEANQEKANNLLRFTNDMERNKVQFKNGDATKAEFDKNETELHKRLMLEQSKVDEDYSAKWQELLQDNADFSLKINDKLLEYSTKSRKAEIDFYKSTLNEILDLKSVNDADYIRASIELRDLEIKEAIESRDAKLKVAGDEAELKKAIWLEYGNEIVAINKKNDDRLESNKDRRVKRELEIAELNREAFGYVTVMGEKINGYLSGQSDEIVSKYKELLNNYVIAVKSGDEAIIEERKRQLDDFKNYIEKINDYATSFFDSFVKDSGFSTLFDVLGKKIAGFGKDWKTTFLGITEIAQEAVNFMSQNSAAYFDAERSRLEDRYNYEIELAGDNDAAKKNIEDSYEQRKRAINIREAKAQRDLALFNIAINTAQAIMGLWVKPGFPAAIPLAVGVGALGLLQAAMVASKPLPAYFTGTMNASEGFAYTDERGAELHTDSSGRIKDVGSDSGPRIKYLAQGDKIYNASKTKEILNHSDFLGSLDRLLFNNNILYNNDNKNQLDATGIISSIKSLQQSVENKESSEEHYDVRGYTKYKRINNQLIEEKNNRIRFKKTR